ncbi:prenyltransferase [Natronococcus sp. A-GB7]|uniref:prenyltransferase n=1 Tax=Natronococcus sp. A-GB7 TaxID=3037649 RepID=UPI0024200479|nr:prenyltransferase [Natronococcus sp. A-GB7]MDG5818983.1 prenyltransferase [Natronococcus sp. A-GB7]
MIGEPIRVRLRERTPRLWTLWAASRPSQLALILLVYALGVGMATAGPPVVVDGADVGSTSFRLSALAGALAVLPVAVAIHYANEYADIETDALTERTPFSSGSGALEATGLSAGFLRRATVGVTVVSGCGVVLAAATLPLDAVGVLVAILLAGLGYSLPPVALIRRGLGEFVNAVLGGLLLPLYGVTVVATPTGIAGLAVVPFVLVVGCNLFATHWPDREADAAVGKRTLVVRWSPRGIRRAYAVLGLGAVAVTTGLWAAAAVPTAVGVATLASLSILVWGWTTLTRQRDPSPSVVAMVVLAVASTVAWWWVGLGP